jgi:branched-chain amino acid transport system ATP-binding protein
VGSAVLKVEEIHTYYGDSYILQGVSLQLEPGKVTGLIGRNGVGKSTLVRSIIGFNPPKRGTISLDGRVISRLPTHVLVKLGVGLVPQERRIFPSLSVLENLTINQRARGPEAPPGRRWTHREIFDLFPILERRAESKGTLLSGGEQQMLAVARALMGNPAYLLMDEPSEGLAPLIVRELGRIIDALKNDGMSILLIEQHVPFVLRHSDEVLIMSKGVLVHRAKPEELAADREVQKKYLGI